MEEKILNFICDYAVENGILPTYREIMAGVGLKSPSSIQIYMERLCRKGEIEFVERRYKVRRLRYVKRESD